MTEDPASAEAETEVAKEGVEPVEAEAVPEEAEAEEIEVVAEEAETEEVEASAEKPEAEEKEAAEKQEAETESVEKAGTTSLEADTDKFRNGNIVTGTVLNVNFQQAEIDLGDGEIGVLSGRHYAAGLQVDLTGELKAGDEVEAAVLIRADHNNRVVLSRTWARSQRAWKKIMEAQKNSTIIEAVIVEAVKGGYSVEIDDARGFLPSSLVVRSELAKAADVSAAEDEGVSGEIAADEEAEVGTMADDGTGNAEAEEKATDGKEAVGKEAIDAEETAVAGESDGDGEAELAEADESKRDDEAARADEPTEADELAEAEPSDKKPDEPQAKEAQSLAPRASDEFVGQIVKCKVIEAKPSSNRYVLSHKAAVRAEQRAKEKERVATLEKGTIVSGKVVALEDFGAFVDIGGARGLLHRTEMAWNHPNEPKEIVKMGESVFCKIIKINQQKAQVGLSLCFGENPISKVEVGQRLTGKVDRLAYAGAIVALEIPDVAVDEGSAADDSSNSDPSSPKCLLHGFVHVSEMSEYPIRRPQRVVLPGDEVAVKVIEVQRKQRRIGLSIIDAVVPDELDDSVLDDGKPSGKVPADASSDEVSASEETDTENEDS